MTMRVISKIKLNKKKINKNKLCREIYDYMINYKS